MPTYQSVCMQCGKYHEYIRRCAQSDDSPECCGVKTEKRILSAPMARMDIQPWDAFESPASGKVITSYAQRREDMARTGCRDWEGKDSEMKYATQQAQHHEQQQDQALESTVRQVWASLSPEKKAAALAAT
jgi:predicted nucleic acid-binding Zn ribbon protein